MKDTAGMLLRARKRTNPLFFADEMRLVAGAERTERALGDPDSVDLLVWNVFGTLERHRDPEWLGARLAALAGDTVRAPVNVSLWTGQAREPLLEPSHAYVDHVRDRVRGAGGADAEVAAFTGPIEVPVRLDAPDVVVLVDVLGSGPKRGRGGRDRLVDLLDAAVEQARRVGKQPAVAVVYAPRTPAAAEVNARVSALRDRDQLARELPHRGALPEVALRETSWREVLELWRDEVDYLSLGGQPVRSFLDHCRRRGLL